MALYEHIIMARQDLSTQQVESMIQQYKNVIESEGGKVTRVENWGLRTLAYRIQKNRKAHYAMLNIDAPATAIFELERQLRINEDVIRFLTIRVEKHEEGASIFMSRRERDESNQQENRSNHAKLDNKLDKKLDESNKEENNNE
ncbi:30S ribosomal protein S6 [Bartonella sp. DGB1]|uniref:30S ribosomal protein S6 n=1 Tax=Bartonella sp. DGB1 TaxID=3239807 RepID=UPI0035241D81